jgi:hypothetical protein
MLDELLSSTAKRRDGIDTGLRIKSISITPWEKQKCSIILEQWLDHADGVTADLWEITCDDLQTDKNVPTSILQNAELKLLETHSLLSQFYSETFFSIESSPSDIQKLMGELFISHCSACGNWIDFGKLYASLPETLESLRANQLAIPSFLGDACFQVLDKHSVKYRINSVYKNTVVYKLLFFSSSNIWPDDLNFGQPYLIATNFIARKISNHQE